jgi:2-polyprenyl-6-methoxyphenol hydroxylase-like FAD-dependent oxidoreductase
MVRSRLGIDYELVAGPEQFAVFEFDSGADYGTEVKIAMDETTTNVLWPLPGGRCRWSFQLVKASDAGEFPAKDREYLWYTRQEEDDRLKHIVERLARNRAPWFKGDIKNVQWSTRVRFEHRLASQFGKNRAWLVGDAAHQTGPVGGQSMNAGLLEAEDLAGALKQILRHGGSRQLLQKYDYVHETDWERLLNRTGRVNAKSSASSWLREHAGRISSCVPATGGQFVQAMDHLGLQFELATPGDKPLDQNQRLRPVS